MKTPCPQCGAEVEFRYDDSFVRVCGFCRSSVLRTDRGVESLGKFADLVEIPSPVRLFCEGRYRGLGFIVVGRTQHRHAAGGTWQEWYAKMDDGRWGWLAEAQGRLYVTFETPQADLPPWSQLRPGQTVPLQAERVRPFTINECSVATHLAAEGEIPFRFVPGAQFCFADLSSADGGFATIDYGDPQEPRTLPLVYVGHQANPQELALTGGEVSSTQAARATSRKLACPQCSGSLELHAPNEAQRLVCQYCGSVLDASHPDLQILTRIDGAPWKAPSLLALGDTLSFEGQRQTLIGIVGREAIIDDVAYPFVEYLLHHPALGFRWLVESDGHWSYVQPVAAGAVTGSAYRGQQFRLFQTALLRVRWVVGEFYWKVSVGEKVTGIDYVAAPAMLSCEQDAREVNWSLGTYLTSKELARALGKAPPADRRMGVAPHQPNRVAMAAKSLGMGCLLVVGAICLRSILADGRTVYSSSVDFRAAELAEPAPAGGQPAIWFSEPFALRSRQNIQIQVSANLNNEWIFVGGDLVNEATGRYVTFERELSAYSGVSGGESWREDSSSRNIFFPAVDAGQYVLRLEAIMAPGTTAPRTQVAVRQDVFRIAHALVAFFAVGIPALLVSIFAFSFERRRWSNSDHAPIAYRAGEESGDDDE